MRGFLVLCLIAVATADKLGYNYQPLGQAASFGIGRGGGFTGGSVESQSGNTGSIEIVGDGGAVHGASSGFGGFTGGATNDAGNFIGSNSGGVVGGGIGFSAGTNNAANFVVANNGAVLDSAAQNDNVSEFNKEFYTYSAPEEEFNDHSASQRIANTLKKSLRVVFIKAPENQALTNAALQLAKQASEDRTAIYVLNKQADIGDLANRLQSLKSNNANKPEVHFIKYRTQDDAARAQQAIQAQYDSLGGQSTSSNEGLAPVLNFASPQTAAVATGHAGHSVGGNGAGGSAASSGVGGSYAAAKAASYLPPALRLK